MIAQSCDIRMTRWSVVACDPLRMLREDAAHFSARLFTFRDQTFELRLRIGAGRRVYFDWRNVANGLHPPISGTVEIAKVGRLAVLALSAAYWFEEDAALALLQAGVGLRPARETLQLASNAIASLLRQRDRAKTREGVLPKPKPQTR
jgi:hypothetical protein